MKRNIDNKLLNQLTASSIWRQKLNADCIDQKVFMAIRDNYVDFYYKGGRLFNFNGRGFKTHLKYASVLEGKGGGLPYRGGAFYL